jgi:putative sterol carrier protein
MPDGFLDDVTVEDIEKFAPIGSHTERKEKAAAVAAANAGNIAALFGKIKSIPSADLVAKVNAVYQFNVKGSEAGVWYCDLKNGSGKVGKGEAASPDAILSMDARNFYDMFTGKIKPASAFMTGKMKITGDLQKAMKLEKLMGGLKSKL